MKRPRLLISFIIILVVVLSVVRISIENSISTTGIELVNLQAKIDAYKKSNEVLEEKYLVDSSLTQIASEAAQKGFVQAKDQVYLSAPLPLAINR